jgi:predicted nucleotidyltransferase
MKAATQRKLCKGHSEVAEHGAVAPHLLRPARHRTGSGLITPRTAKSLPSAQAPNAAFHVEARQQDLELVREFAQRVRARIGSGIVAFRWFGSRRAGTAAPDSDVDILLETEAALTSAQRDVVLDTSIEMAAMYGCTMDVHYYTSRELRSRRFRRTPFIISVLSEGAEV